MNKIVLSLLLIWGMVPLMARAETVDEKMGRASAIFLNSVISDILHDPETAKYFSAAKFDPKTLVRKPNGDGWWMGWTYEHDIRWVPNPGGQTLEKPVFDHKESILFTIFVASNHGDAMCTRVKMYKILQEPRLIAAFNLKTEGDSVALQKKMDVIARAHLDACRETLTSP
jgi:hypothetical protein